MVDPVAREDRAEVAGHRTPRLPEAVAEPGPDGRLGVRGDDLVDDGLVEGLHDLGGRGRCLRGDRGRGLRRLEGRFPAAPEDDEPGRTEQEDDEGSDQREFHGAEQRRGTTRWSRTSGRGA